MKRAIAMAMMITIPVLMLPALVAAQTPVAPGADQVRRHEQINLFEGALERAVTNAARRVAKDVQSRNSSANLMTSDAHAKGFILDGYGVFVYVEVPALDLTLSLFLDQLERDAPAPQRADADPKPVSDRAPDEKVDKVEPSPVIPKIARENLKSVMDTGEKYHTEVKLQLADTMLDFSKNLELKADEWLSVAARGSDGSSTPGDLIQRPTVVLRIKGSDLADYLAGRLTKDEARTKVEVRQF